MRLAHQPVRMPVAALAILSMFAVAMASGSSAHAADDAVSYQRTAYDGTIWQVSETTLSPLTWDQWSALGFPDWVPASTEYLKVLDMPTVYAVTRLDGADDGTVVDVITYPEYQQAGYPAVRSTPWMDGLTLKHWATSPDLIVTDPAGYSHTLTASEWQDAGFPPYIDKVDQGFVQMSWDGSGGIAYMCSLSAGKGGRLTYSQWVAAGSPTPSHMTRTPGDLVIQVPGRAPRIDYVGPMSRSYPRTLGGQLRPLELTYAEWSAMGRPAPWVTNTWDDLPTTCGYDSPALTD